MRLNAEIHQGVDLTEDHYNVYNQRIQDAQRPSAVKAGKQSPICRIFR